MNWTIGKVEKKLFVRITLEGDFDIKDFFEIFGSLFALEYWQMGMHLLFDDSRLNLSEINYEMIRHASDCYSHHYSNIGDGKIAMLMKSVPDFGRGRQFQLLTEMQVPANINIFTDEAEAVIWLEAKPDLYNPYAESYGIRTK
ncbi:MAG: hypothetical protein WA584_22035 [Pyrinomonadaceae bacterium]